MTLSERHLAFLIIPLLLGGAVWSFYKTGKGVHPVEAPPVPDLVGERTKKIDAALRGPAGPDALKEALESGPPLSSQTLGSLIRDASFGGRTDQVAVLLDHGADPNGNGLGEPLLYAVSGQKLDMVDLLLKRGAVPDRRSDRSATALALAVQFEGSPIVDRLLKAGADPNLFVAWLKILPENQKRKGGQRGFVVGTEHNVELTPLMIAASKGRLKNLKSLLRYKADRTLKSDQGTAAQIAQLAGFPQAARLLGD